MSKNILIVENDSALSRAMKDKLVARGFEVSETSDGKGCAELIRRSKPNLVVLAVDLSAGQNGYIICKKLKSDDDLKGIPVVIVGNPDGFGQHKKLKTHADDYLGKPFDPQAIIDRAGALIGLPDPVAQDQEIVEDESLSLNELLDEDKPASPAEDISLDGPTHEETVGNGDPDFEMVDAMFDEKTAAGGAAKPSPEPEEELKSAEYSLDEEAAVDQEIVEEDAPIEEEAALEEAPSEDAPLPPMPEDDFPPAEKTQIGMMPVEPPPPPPSSAPPPAPVGKPSAAEAGELRSLKSKVTELTGSLSESKGRAEELEEKVRQLETDLESRQAELDTARTAGGKSDNKDLFALKDQLNKKDKEILRLKNELNEKENEVVDLHEKETALEQQMSESSGEIARRDAQIKTLTTKSDQLSAERKKIDQQMMAAKEEARSSGAKLSTLQGEFDSLQDRTSSMEGELETLRNSSGDAESARQVAESQLSEVKGDFEALKSQQEEREREIDDLRSQLEQAQIDLDSAKNQLTSQATAFAEEIGGLRRRIGELEEQGGKHEDRVKALFGRIKSEESVRERTREALQQALAALDEQPDQSVDDLMAEDELAEA